MYMPNFEKTEIDFDAYDIELQECYKLPGNSPEFNICIENLRHKYGFEREHALSIKSVIVPEEPRVLTGISKKIVEAVQRKPKRPSPRRIQNRLEEPRQEISSIKEDKYSFEKSLAATIIEMMEKKKQTMPFESVSTQMTIIKEQLSHHIKNRDVTKTGFQRAEKEARKRRPDLFRRHKRRRASREIRVIPERKGDPSLDTMKERLLSQFSKLNDTYADVLQPERILAVTLRELNYVNNLTKLENADAAAQYVREQFPELFERN